MSPRKAADTWKGRQRVHETAQKQADQSGKPQGIVCCDGVLYVRPLPRAERWVEKHRHEGVALLETVKPAVAS